MKAYYYLFVFVWVTGFSANAQNPLITSQFTADPTARVFGDSMYVYPSHDIPVKPGHGRPGWFCMEDYHVFSSADLTHWKDHGIIVSQYHVPWADSNAYSMWAPDCIERNGKYYFYFPTMPKDTSYGRGFAIGVATADKPYGPFVPQAQPIRKVHGIDPNVFIDKNGQAYLYWAQGNIYMAKLKENMLELASDPVVINNLPDKGLKEGPFLFERNGIYYLTYPHVANKTERLEYAVADNPMGPFHVKGVIMDESPTGCWTNHQSIVQFHKQWYLFYHHNDLSPQFDKNRSIRADSLFFEADGSIRKVIPSLRGVGRTLASDRIEIDRYTSASEKGVSLAFLDSTNHFAGWKAIITGPGAWIQYNSVDFGKIDWRNIQLRAQAPEGGTIQVRMDKLDGPVIATCTLSRDSGWTVYLIRRPQTPKGVHPLFIIQQTDHPVAIDWIHFN